MPIPSPIHPSLNSWMIMKRQQANALKQKYKDYVAYVARKAGYAGMNISDCDVTIRYYFPTNRRHDSDNYTPKFYMDGLTEAGVIVDDDFAHVHSLTMYGGYDSDNPRAEIIITYKTEETDDGND